MSEGGSGEAGWLTVQPDLSKLLEPIRPIIEAIDSVLEALLLILNIVQFILNIIKAFLIGLLDPIRAIIEAIIEEIRNIINDLRQLGLYIHGDHHLFKFSNRFKDLRGGFTAYQTRMISRLVDRSDPDRPDWSSSSAAVAAFFYISGQDIDDLIRLIMKIINFFKGMPATKTNPLPRCSTPTVSYGTEGAGMAAFKALGDALAGSGSVPEEAVISWSLPTPTGGLPGTSYAAPRAFLVEVSTFRDGFTALGCYPKATGDGWWFANSLDPASGGLLRCYSPMDTVGFGDLVQAGGYTEYQGTDTTSTYGTFVDPDGSPWMGGSPTCMFFTMSPNDPWIPPCVMKDGEKTYFGKAWLVSNTAISKILGGGTFTIMLKKSEMPVHATVETNSDGTVKLVDAENPTYYVRVRALGKSVYQDLGSPSSPMVAPTKMGEQDYRLWNFSQDALARADTPTSFAPYGPGRWAPPSDPGDQGSAPEPNPDGASSLDIGPVSAPVELTFPTDSSMAYIEALTAAFVTAQLVSNFPGMEKGEFTADSAYAFNDASRYAAINPLGNAAMQVQQKCGFGPKLTENKNYLMPLYRGKNPKGFRAQVLRNAIAWAGAAYRRINPSENFISVVEDLAKDLLEFKWSDIDSKYPSNTILESVGYQRKTNDVAKEAFTEAAKGVAGNLAAIPWGPDNPNRMEAWSSTDRPRTLTSSPGVADGTELEFDPGPLFIPDPNQTLNAMASSAPSTIPVVYGGTPSGVKADYICNVLPDEVMYSAETILFMQGRMMPSSAGGWIAVRPFDKALAPVNEILDKIERFLMAILDGLQGLVDEIIRYIEGIQKRIYQLQMLIQYIRSLLRMIDMFALPSCAGLILVENGTDGLLQGLVMATDKPEDDRSAYGGGMVIAAGGLPLILLELLAAIMGGGGDD